MKLADANGIVRLTHFTPQSRAHWCWAFVIPIMSLIPGPQKIITGQTVVHPGGGMWGGVSDAPSFPTRAEALAWAEANGVQVDSVEIEPSIAIGRGECV